MDDKLQGLQFYEVELSKIKGSNPFTALRGIQTELRCILYFRSKTGIVLRSRSHLILLFSGREL